MYIRDEEKSNLQHPICSPGWFPLVLNETFGYPEWPAHCWLFLSVIRSYVRYAQNLLTQEFQLIYRASSVNE